VKGACKRQDFKHKIIQSCITTSNIKRILLQFKLHSYQKKNVDVFLDSWSIQKETKGPKYYSWCGWEGHTIS
jgi:hypothetical protein